MRSLRMMSLLCAPTLVLGCYTLEPPEENPGDEDAGVIDISERDSGPDPVQDSGPPPPPPPDAGPPEVEILSFAADTTDLAFLGTTVLRWNVAAALSCALDPDLTTVTLPAGNVTLESGQPGDAVTYTLTCQGEGGPVSQQVTVTTVLVTEPGATVNSTSELNAYTGVNVVTGDLIIDGALGLLNLQSLERLVEVEGNLFVMNNVALTDLTLPNLERVGGTLGIDGNTALTTLSLPEIVGIGSKLYVSRNPDVEPTDIGAIVASAQAGEGVGGPVIDYYNDPVTVLSSLSQTVLCTHNSVEGLFLLDFYPSGNFELFVPAQVSGFQSFGFGTYDENNKQLRLQHGQFAHGTNQTTTTVEMEYDRVTAFQSSDFSLCWITAVPGQGALAFTEFQCPFVPTGQYEERNSVFIDVEGQARWDYTVVDTNNGGQQMDSLPGAFVIDGDWLLFAFPRSISPLFELRYPSGRLNVAQDELFIEDLDVEFNPCERQ